MLARIGFDSNFKGKISQKKKKKKKSMHEFEYPNYIAKFTA